jgi:hypothetical protein
MQSEENPFGISITKRTVSSGAEKELFYNHRIGNNGEVELVDYIGSDDAGKDVVIEAKHAEKSYLELRRMYDWTKVDCVMGRKIKVSEDIHEEIYSIFKPSLTILRN